MIRICLTVFLSAMPVAAQSSSIHEDPKSVTFMWLEPGIGRGGVARDNFAASLSLNLQHRLLWLSGRISASQELQIFQLRKPDERGLEYSFSGGPMLKNRWFYVGMGAGFSRVEGTRRGGFLEDDDECFLFCAETYEEIRYKRNGFVVETAAGITPLPFFGLGVRAYSNHNQAKRFMGWMVTLQFGAITR